MSNKKLMYRLTINANRVWLENFMRTLEWLDILWIEYHSIQGNELRASTDWEYFEDAEVRQSIQEIADFFRVPIQCEILDRDDESETEVTFEPSPSKTGYWSSKLLELSEKLRLSEKAKRSMENHEDYLNTKLREASEMNQLLIRDNKRLMGRTDI